VVLSALGFFRSDGAAPPIVPGAASGMNYDLSSISVLEPWPSSGGGESLSRLWVLVQEEGAAKPTGRRQAAQPPGGSSSYEQVRHIEHPSAVYCTSARS